MNTEMLFSELRRRYADLSSGTDSCSRIAKEDFSRWCVDLGLSRASLYEVVGTYLARGFHASELDFAFCDAVANDLFTVAVEADDGKTPELFWQVFLAFDAGEQHKPFDDDDPVETRTRPLIAEIVMHLSNKPLG